MPLFEFVCKTCGKPFEELVRSSGAVSEVKCPECGSPQVQKKLSTFASRMAGGSSFSIGSSAASCSTGGT